MEIEVARRKSKRKKRKRSSRSSTRAAWHPSGWSIARPNRQAVLRGLLGASWLVVLSSLGVGWAYAVPRMQEYASQNLARESILVELPEFPGWLQPSVETTGAQADQLEQTKQLIASSINRSVAGRIGADPFDRIGLAAVHEALEHCGWFSTVRQVRRSGVGVVEIDADFVEPFTMIRDVEGSHLVTESGILLPLQFPVTGKLKRQPVITGVRFARPWQPGERWEGSDITAALALAKMLEGHEWTEQIVEIDVSEFMQTESLWLTTDQGARILWGRPPGEERGREVPALQKLSYLEKMYGDSGRVDRNLRQLDLVFDSVYAR